MRIDACSMSFNVNIRTDGGNPSWGTSLGTSRPDYKINTDKVENDLLTSMIYCAVNTNNVNCTFGRGGNGGNYEIELASIFNKIYVNDNEINDAKYLLLITKENDPNHYHFGRRTLKYNPNYQYNNEDINNDCISKIKNKFSLTDNSAWFIYSIETKNQDELHFTMVVVDVDNPVEYSNSTERSNNVDRLAAENGIQLNGNIINIGEALEKDNKEFALYCFDVLKKNNLLNRETIRILTNLDECRSKFRFQYCPILLEVDQNESYKEQCWIGGLQRYYPEQIVVKSKQYYITNNWFEENRKPFIDWIISVSNEKIISKENGIQKFPVFDKLTDNKNPLNQIIYGAPGTGKTYSMPEYAVAILTNKTYSEIHKEYKGRRQDLLKEYNRFYKEKQVIFTTFHQNYGYEDFIQGIRPKTESSNLTFNKEDGVFKKLVDEALNNADKNYVLIIDEINRGNISKIFGELITLIEDDKRWGEEEQMFLQLTSGEYFTIPNNLYIVGTMNSADKSIALIDTALRRRFTFIEKSPDESEITDSDLKAIFNKLNNKIYDELKSSDMLIGHSYFINKNKNELESIFNNNIIPLLYEYFYGEEESIRDVIINVLEGFNYTIDNSQQSNKFGRIKIKKAQEQSAE